MLALGLQLTKVQIADYFIIVRGSFTACLCQSFSLVVLWCWCEANRGLSCQGFLDFLQRFLFCCYRFLTKTLSSVVMKDRL